MILQADKAEQLRTLIVQQDPTLNWGYTYTITDYLDAQVAQDDIPKFYKACTLISNKLNTFGYKLEISPKNGRSGEVAGYRVYFRNLN